MKTKAGIHLIVNDGIRKYDTNDTLFSYEADKNRKGVVVTVANSIYHCGSMSKANLDSLTFRASREQLEALAKNITKIASEMKYV